MKGLFLGLLVKHQVRPQVNFIFLCGYLGCSNHSPLTRVRNHSHSHFLFVVVVVVVVVVYVLCGLHLGCSDQYVFVGISS
jgi:hypothetical protein